MGVTSILKNDFDNHTILKRLLNLHDIPKVINMEGQLPEVSIDEYGRYNPRILTIVGSRKSTRYGALVVEKLVSSLKGQPVIILSGLALGIDGLAHKYALINSLKTIAIPGSGLDRSVLYPKSHMSLAKEIVDSGGVLLSELDNGVGAAPWTFPARNRIMAVLSDVLLVIEAEEKSGTLITARQALELGKDIGVVPGDIFSLNSKGTNALIKEGATPITTEEDLFNLLNLPYKKTITELSANFSQEEKLILSLLGEPRGKDSLLEESRLPFETFISAFSTLEINGYIEELFGEVRKII